VLELVACLLATGSVPEIQDSLLMGLGATWGGGAAVCPPSHSQ